MDEVLKFRKLGRNVLFDYCLFENKHHADLATFNLLLRVEEGREKWGFTGIRKERMVVMIEMELARKRGDKAVINDEEIAEYAKEKASSYYSDFVCTE